MNTEMEKTSEDLHPRHPGDLPGTLERLDKLLSATKDEERLRTGLGIRLAVGMADELRQGLPLGSRTAMDVAAWMGEFGRDTVDAAVAIAREFLTKPQELRLALEQRLKDLGTLGDHEARAEDPQDGPLGVPGDAMDHALEPGRPA